LAKQRAAPTPYAVGYLDDVPAVEKLGRRYQLRTAGGAITLPPAVLVSG
jgi:hypothetical protein